MASSYSDLGLELMVTGENAGTWGDKTNSNLNLIQQSVAGYEAVALSDGGTVTLAMTDATLSNARNMVIKFTGTLTTASTVTIPDGIEKFYIFDCSAVVAPTNLTIKTVSGTGFTLNAAKIFAAYSDGTNLNEISLDTLGGSIAAADITGTISTAQIADNAVTTAKISDNQITTAKISDNQITTAKVSDLQITTAKIANDAVGPDQLSNTAVTAGAYSTADITVDAQGRITAASDGSSGGGGLTPKIFVNSGGNGTFNSNGTQYLAYAISAGGGSGGRGHGNSYNGGSGLYSIFTGTLTPPFSQPYSVGSGGGGGNPFGNAGSAGGTTNIANLFSINGGNGGGPWTGGPNGSSGNVGSGSPSFNTTSKSSYYYISSNSNFGTGGANNSNPGSPGVSGQPGAMVVLDNS